MRTEQRTVYISEDGKEYDTEEACRLHEQVLVIEATLTGLIDPFESDLGSVATALVEHKEQFIQLLQGV